MSILAGGICYSVIIERLLLPRLSSLISHIHHSVTITITISTTVGCKVYVNEADVVVSLANDCSFLVFPPHFPAFPAPRGPDIDYLSIVSKLTNMYQAYP